MSLKSKLQGERQPGYLQGLRGGGINLLIIGARLYGIQLQSRLDVVTVLRQRLTESMRCMAGQERSVTQIINKMLIDRCTGGNPINYVFS